MFPLSTIGAGGYGGGRQQPDQTDDDAITDVAPEYPCDLSPHPKQKENNLLRTARE